jgi:hypothetical protein
MITFDLLPQSLLMLIKPLLPMVALKKVQL